MLKYSKMANIFPPWFNQLPLKIAGGLVLCGSLAVTGAWYYLTPKYSRVGYTPVQPVPFSHKTHIDQMGLDCRYCHDGVEKSWYANVPSPSVCMNCHSQILANDPRLAPVRASYKSGEPVPWVQIHRTPDFVYFNHAVHVNRGVSCLSCHGQVNQMVEVRHEKSLTMAFCLDCHRDPAPSLRPLDQVYNLNWTNDPAKQAEMGKKFVHDWKINASQNCYTCHR
jgi:hypothetical protein